MVRSIKYNSFKKPELFRKMNFNSLVIAILIFIFIASQPSVALFLCGVLYVLSGPFMMLRRYRQIRRKEAGKLKKKENTSTRS
jgi:CDP-diacylglycerol--serine O-phosphatidyltransferase